jgi:hypothetical protein
MINHKKRKERQERGSTSQKKSLLSSEKVYLSHKEIWDKSQGYKYPTIHCPLGVGDNQETQERREISWVSPM